MGNSLGICRGPAGCTEHLTIYPADLDFFQAYEIGDLIGTGTFGQVRECTATDVDDGTIHAVKLIDKDHVILQTNSAYLKAHDEVKILQNIRHPCIVQLIDFFEDERFMYVVMEKIDGGQLFDRLAEDMSEVYESDVANVAMQLFSAIEYLHSVGIVHRDVKPENILLVDFSPDRREANRAEAGGAFGFIKLIDFGFACFLHPPSCAFFTGATNEAPLTFVCGSPTYVAPEILEGCYGKKVDVWAAGVVLYLMLFAQYPYWCPNDPEETNRLICACEPPAFIAACKRDWKPSRLVRKFLLLLLQKDVNKRPDASRALRHAWIENGGCEEDEAVSPEVPEDVRRNVGRFVKRTPPSPERESDRTMALQERSPEHSSPAHHGRHRRREASPEKTPECKSWAWNSETGSPVPISPFSPSPEKGDRFLPVSQSSVEDDGHDISVIEHLMTPCQVRCC